MAEHVRWACARACVCATVQFIDRRCCCCGGGVRSNVCVLLAFLPFSLRLVMVLPEDAYAARAFALSLLAITHFYFIILFCTSAPDCCPAWCVGRRAVARGAGPPSTAGVAVDDTVRTAAAAPADVAAADAIAVNELHVTKYVLLRLAILSLLGYALLFVSLFGSPSSRSAAWLFGATFALFFMASYVA